MTARPERASLLDIVTVPVPSGEVEPPLDDHHVLDLHLGSPVEVTCRMDGRDRRGLQIQGHFSVIASRLGAPLASRRASD